MHALRRGRSVPIARTWLWARPPQRSDGEVLPGKMGEKDLRLLVVADDLLARAGLASIMASQPGVLVVGQCPPGAGLEQAVAASQPDVLLWDLGSTAEVDREQLAQSVAMALPIVALLLDHDALAEARGLGLRGLLLREASGEVIAAAVLAAAAGLQVLDPALEPERVSPAPGDTQPPSEPLTPREIEVLHLLAEGLTNKAIASRLDVSEHTVKFHVNAVLRKLHAQSRTEAVVHATRLGLILL